MPHRTMMKGTAHHNCRVWYISRAYGTDAGGMERLSFELAQALSQHTTLSITVTGRASCSRLTLPFWVAARWVQIVFTAWRFDVILIGDPVLACLAWTAQRLWKRPVVCMVHGLDVMYAHPFFQLYLRLFFRGLSQYLPISSWARRALSRHWHIPEERVEVVRPGLVHHARTTNDARLFGEIPDGAFVLLTIGRLVTRKGQAWFVREVLPKLPAHVVYVIVGRGPGLQDIYDAASAADVAGRVILLGRVSDENLGPLYRRADVFIQPNIAVAHDAEGLGLSVVEAGMLGVPVLAANREGLVDAIDHGVNGLLVESGNAGAWQDAIESEIANPGSISVNEAHTKQTFDWSRVAKQYERVLRGLC